MPFARRRRSPTIIPRFCALSLLLLCWPGLAAIAAPSVAFYYAPNPPAHLLAHFDHIVVEPAHVDAATLADLQAEGRTVHAYVSIGELADSRPEAATLPAAWRLGRNPAWNSQVMDLASPDWREHLFTHHFRPLWERGFRGFFLDTLDSHEGIDGDAEFHRRQRQGFVTLITRLREEFPDARLFVNRGFAVIDTIAPLIDGVAAESLHAGWDPVTRRYRAVSETDRQWLRQRLRAIRERFPRLLLMVLDYLPPGERARGRRIAASIAADGFVPWISDIAQSRMGIGAVEVLPREILMLYDSRQEHAGALRHADIHLLAALPVEYLGYVPVYHDLARGLPPGPLAGRYAGVIAWLHADVPEADRYRRWLLARLAEDVPFLLLEHPGFALNGAFLGRLGLQLADGMGHFPWTLRRRDDLIGFEAEPPTLTDSPARGFRPGTGGNEARLVMADRDGREHAMIVTGAWGGIALSPWFLEQSGGDRIRWITDPFALIRAALHLPDLPQPVVTTRHGRRLWTTHIDGDGFASRAELPGTPYAGEVILNRIIARQPVPHTVSVIEGEIGETGLYPEQAPELMAIARRIFRLPHVEPASHSYSHPFVWNALSGNTRAGAGYNLPIPGYRFRLERELLGSIDFVNRLLPAGRRCRLFLWTGDTAPGPDALRLLAEHGIDNVNGGNTRIGRNRPFLAAVSPMGVTVGDQFQIYAPVSNENDFTNLWQGPYYGYRDVVETFAMTDTPRRLKPIGIYYHFYSGTKPAALKALETVYAWARKQETAPVPLGHYARLVKEFRRITLARRLDGRLQYRGIDHLRQLRRFTGGLDFTDTRQVAGQRRLHDGLYLHLAGPRPVLRLSNDAPAPARPHLRQTNGEISRWRTDADGRIEAEVQAGVPLILELGGVSRACRLVAASGPERRFAADVDGRVRIQLDTPHRFSGRLTCR